MIEDIYFWQGFALGCIATGFGFTFCMIFDFHERLVGIFKKKK